MYPLMSGTRRLCRRVRTSNYTLGPDFSLDETSQAAKVIIVNLEEAGSS